MSSDSLTKARRVEAQAQIAQLLLQYCGDTAFERLSEHATISKQSAQEAAWRAAGNLLTSFSLDRPTNGW